MALPLYLAMTASEMSSCAPLSHCLAYMACHFSPYSQGLSNLPTTLPEKSMLILNDNFPCQGHCPGLIAQQLSETLASCQCESLLLDFQRPSCPETEQIIDSILSVVHLPIAISQGHGHNHNGPVFLPPCPLHIPLQEYLSPWSDREIWLEAALCQEDVRITQDGSTFVPQFPPNGFNDGFFDETLCCNYQTRIEEKAITFTLFDTAESLDKKMSQAQTLGVSRAVGLWQELG